MFVLFWGWLLDLCSWNSSVNPQKFWSSPFSRLWPGNESSRFSLATSKCGRRQLSCQWTLSWMVSIDIYCIYTFKLSRLSFAFETRKLVSMWRKSATKSTIEANPGPGDASISSLSTHPLSNHHFCVTLRPSVSLENPPAGDLVEEGFKGLLQRQLKVLSKVQQKLVKWLSDSTTWLQ